LVKTLPNHNDVTSACQQDDADMIPVHLFVAPSSLNVFYDRHLGQLRTTHYRRPSTICLSRFPTYADIPPPPEIDESDQIGELDQIGSDTDS
jgi:hypothetical protein